jgi:hypothetical protein
MLKVSGRYISGFAPRGRGFFCTFDDEQRYALRFSLRYARVVARYFSGSVPKSCRVVRLVKRKAAS